MKLNQTYKRSFAKPKKRRLLRGILVSLAVLVLVGLGIAIYGVRQYYNHNLTPVNSAAQDKIVIAIASGSSLKQISTQLKDKKLIRSTWAFERYVSSHQLGDKLQAGTFRFSQSQPASSIVADLVSGKVAVDLFTFLPQQRLDQLRAAFIKAGFSEASTDDALNPGNYSGYAALSDKPSGASLEGYLYPDSFQRTAETTPKTLVAASLTEMGEALTPGIRAGFAKQGLTTHQAIILASIVEKEVASQNDRNTAAQVFLKRLREGIRLQSDVTVLYGSAVGGQDPPSLAFDSAYNTFTHDGLPVGPIGNVNTSGLEAVANPANTDYLYFVAGDDGATYFSYTLKEHEQAINDHCKKLCSQ